MGIKTVAHPPYSPDLAPRDFWLFPQLKGCRYVTIEEMKEAVTKVIDMITQEDFHGNLFNDPRIYIYIYTYIHTHTHIYISTSIHRCVNNSHDI